MWLCVCVYAPVALAHLHQQITPDRARLTPDESMDLTVEWVCQEAGPLSSAVEVTVQGGRTLRLPFKSEGVLPRVEVQQVRRSLNVGGIVNALVHNKALLCMWSME